jgi:hypothetical protein
MIRDTVKHPAYGIGEVVDELEDGSKLVRFRDLPGGHYEKNLGPAIMSMLLDYTRLTSQPAEMPFQQPSGMA